MVSVHEVICRDGTCPRWCWAESMCVGCKAAPADRLRIGEAGLALDASVAHADGRGDRRPWQCLAGRCAWGPKVLAGLLRALAGVTLDDLVDRSDPNAGVSA